MQMYKVWRNHSFVKWERQNLKKSEREENGETKVEEKQASPLVSRTHTCFLYLTQYISYLTDVHESHAEYYYLARSSLPHLLSHPTDWEARGRYWRPSEHPWGFSSSSQVIFPVAMTVICVLVQMTIFGFHKSLSISIKNVAAIGGSKFNDSRCWDFSPNLSFKIYLFCHLYAVA